MPAPSAAGPDGEAFVEATLELRGIERLVGFGRLLRSRGLPVGTGRILAFCRAVAALSRFDRDSLYLAGRLTMIARKEDFDAYDLAFEQWFPRARDRLRAELAGWQPEPRVSIEREIEVLVGEALSDEAGSDERDEGDEEVTIGLVASGIEMLRVKSFEDLSEAERHEADLAIRRIGSITASWWNRRSKRRPLVLLLDVSG